MNTSIIQIREEEFDPELHNFTFHKKLTVFLNTERLQDVNTLHGENTVESMIGSSILTFLKESGK